MLFNPNWTPAETKPDVFSLESLIAWLETMPGDGVYCFTDSGSCLLTQWMHRCGETVEYTFVSDFPRAWQDIAMGSNTDLNSVRYAKELWTWGLALTRARQALADQGFRALADTSREAV